MKDDGLFLSRNGGTIVSEFGPSLSDLSVREGSLGSSPASTIEFVSCISEMYCSLVKLLVDYLSNRTPKVSMVYRLINHARCC